MLFQSLAFIFVFLPIAFILVHGMRSVGGVRYALIAVSLIFYGWWNWRLLGLLIGAVVISWLFAERAIHTGRRSFLVAGVVFNLVLLGLFKYANFFAEAGAALTQTNATHFDIALPLAISFFTFHQISYLVDIARGERKLYGFADYSIYISFFPHLIAGPIVRHKEFMPQLALIDSSFPPPQMLANGLGLFILGLAKKLWLADPLSHVADPLFSAAATAPLAPVDGVFATLTFALQIYFDFSAYTDMAIGLGLLFGIPLPRNFKTPYRATSLIDFWRRWHMTLSRYLRDYLYIPLGGNRSGHTRQVLALFLTMLLGGLWHGAAWTFVIWGALHGGALVSNHQWRRYRLPMPKFVGWLLTFTFVAIAFVVFRAGTIGQALNVVAPIIDVATWFALPITVSPKSTAYLCIGLVLALYWPKWPDNLENYIRPQPVVAIAFGVLATMLVITIIGADGYAPFLYFQF